MAYKIPDFKDPIEPGDLIAFGDRFRQFRRQQLKLSQPQLGKLIGVKTSNTFVRWENGEKTPELIYILRLAKLYPDIDLHYLLTGEQSPVVTQKISELKPYLVEYMRTAIVRLAELNQQKQELIEDAIPEDKQQTVMHLKENELLKYLDDLHKANQEKITSIDAEIEELQKGLNEAHKKIYGALGLYDKTDLSEFTLPPKKLENDT